MRLRLLSSNALGLAIAVPWCLLCLLALQAAASRSDRWPLVVAGAGLLAGALLLAAALRHLWKLHRFNRRFPAPGRILNIHGTAMHILAEGPRTAPPVVWIPGGHDPGVAMWHLHKALAAEHRSILFDRPGSGWSSINRAPRTPTVEAAELHALLREAGETGPYVLAGHSLGGMLAASFAAQFPSSTAGLVLLDAGTADNFAFTSKWRGTRYIPGDSLRLSIMAAFGLLWSRLPKQSPEDYDGSEQGQMRLGLAAQPKGHTVWVHTLDAIFADLLGILRLPGSLGDMPLFSVVPPADTETQRDVLGKAVPELSDLQIANIVALHQQGRWINAALSRAGEVRIAPSGTTHGIPDEVPEFVLGEVREMLRRVGGGPQRS